MKEETMQYVYQTLFPEKTFLSEAQQVSSPPKILLKQDGCNCPVPRKGEIVSIKGVKRMVLRIRHTPLEYRVYIELGGPQ